MATHRIKAGPHLLFVGADNGRKTFGVTIENLGWKPDRDYAYSRFYDFNETSIARWNPERVSEQLGVSPDEVRRIKAEVAALDAAQ